MGSLRAVEKPVDVKAAPGGGLLGAVGGIGGFGMRKIERDVKGGRDQIYSTNRITKRELGTNLDRQ